MIRIAFSQHERQATGFTRIYFDTHVLKTTQPHRNVVHACLNASTSNHSGAQLRTLETAQREVGSRAGASNAELIVRVDVDALVASFDISDELDTSSDLYFWHDVVVGHVATEFDTDTPVVAIGTTRERRVR